MEGLRQRPKAAASTDRAFNLSQLQAVQEQAAPIFVFLASVAAVIEPVADKLSDFLQLAWTIVQPYHPEDLFVVLYGLGLVFFGGVYMTLVASLEAAHQFGWDRIKAASHAFYQEWKNARAAFERDNQVDANFDGVADVDQLAAKDLAARRMMVLTRSVNPENISIALEGLTMATVAILATLRVRFAKAITLGTAIGEVLNKIFSPFTAQLLDFGLPEDYDKWIPVRCCIYSNPTLNSLLIPTHTSSHRRTPSTGHKQVRLPPPGNESFLDPHARNDQHICRYARQFSGHNGRLRLSRAVQLRRPQHLQGRQPDARCRLGRPRPHRHVPTDLQRLQDTLPAQHPLPPARLRRTGRHHGCRCLGKLACIILPCGISYSICKH